jgi:hypothetical protein
LLQACLAMDRLRNTATAEFTASMFKLLPLHLRRSRVRLSLKLQALSPGIWGFALCRISALCLSHYSKHMRSQPERHGWECGPWIAWTAVCLSVYLHLLRFSALLRCFSSTLVLNLTLLPRYYSIVTRYMSLNSELFCLQRGMIGRSKP